MNLDSVQPLNSYKLPRRADVSTYRNPWNTNFKINGEYCDSARLPDPDMLDEFDNNQPAPDYTPCSHCNGEGVLLKKSMSRNLLETCPECDGYGALDVNPHATNAHPGTNDKIVVLAARYALGLPLWNSDDVTVKPPETVHDLLELI